MNTLVDNMNALAERDNLINHLQSLINGHKLFLGGGGVKLTDEEKNKLKTLEDYLKNIGRGGEKDLETVSALLTQN